MAKKNQDQAPGNVPEGFIILKMKLSRVTQKDPYEGMTADERASEQLLNTILNKDDNDQPEFLTEKFLTNARIKVDLITGYYGFDDYTIMYHDGDVINVQNSPNEIDELILKSTQSGSTKE